MIDPVLGSVSCEWKLLDIVLVDAISKMEEDTEGSLRENSMCRLRENVVAGKV
jgi:hypothetical protein